MNIVNEMRLDFPALPENEAFARMVISGFILPLNPTLEELADVKTAVSEAVTNAVVHGYGCGRGTVRLHALYSEDEEPIYLPGKHLHRYRQTQALVHTERSVRSE